MHRLQQVVHRLHGVEGLDRHFDKDGNPVGHSAIPEAWQLEGFQLTAILRLVGDEAGVGIHIIRQVEGLALVVPTAAYQVDGVEVGRALEDGFLLGVLVVDLR